MSALRLDLIVRRYMVQPHPDSSEVPEPYTAWTWRLWSGSRIVATSGSQRYSRRLDCARGAEVGAGLCGVVEQLRGKNLNVYRHGHTPSNGQVVELRLIDERTL